MAAGPRYALILDDDRLLASLISSMLEDHGFVCHVAHDISEARKVLRRHELDVALLDVHLGDGPSGVQFSLALQKSQPGVGIVFLTKTPDLVASGVRVSDLPEHYGVAGKDNLGDETELLDAIESVLSERRTPVRHETLTAGPLQSLTAHQLRVLREVASGLTNRSIAERFGVTERSVERSLQAIFQRLHIAHDGPLNPRVEAIRQYVEVFGFPPRS